MGGKATRVAFGEALARLGGEHENIVVLDADLSKSTMSEGFAKRYPHRFFEMGIAEGNMVGTGAGLALAGKIPFICSFACFVAGRYEQIRMSIAYNRANVKIVGTHAGIGIGEDGYSQMGLEDMALMRALPSMGVVQPADALETEQAVEYLVQHEGPVFLRLSRQKLEDISPRDYRFRFGKGVVLREGGDVAIFATGGVIYNALLASDQLLPSSIHASVINIATVKPIDEELIVRQAKQTGRLITVEDHGIVGGLGSAVAEVLAEHCPARLRRIAMRTFGESGDPAQLYDKYGFSPEKIAATTRQFLAEE